MNEEKRRKKNNKKTGTQSDNQNKQSDETKKHTSQLRNVIQKQGHIENSIQFVSSFAVSAVKICNMCTPTWSFYAYYWFADEI